MMFQNIVTLLPLAFMAMANAQSDYLNPLVAPPTVYEATTPSPQNMDFDSVNNMFVAHSGWYQDRLVHYYKFRMYTPGTYPGLIAPGVTADAVPVQKIYFVTTTGDFTGVVGKPIIEFHTQDGLDYSDFMAVTFVDAPANYTEDSFRSAGDVMASGAAMTDTNIVLNIPVVPTGSTLQHPWEKGTAPAPIQPVPVLYRGVEVWTYVFEVSDSTAGDFFAYTRSPAISPERQNNQLVTGFEIPVLPFYADADRVSAIPLWHVNQFSRGVVEGNGGGPNPAGMRNVIDMDRPDPGYSPLWHIWWATEMPVNYSADQFSNAVQGTADNGFAFFEAPMYVNCPDIGLVGEEINAMKKDMFKAELDLSSDDMMMMDSDKFVIIGSHPSLIMQGGVTVTFKSDDGTILGATQTTGMGGYEFELMKSTIPEGAIKVKVFAGDEETEIRKILIATMEDEDMTDSDSVPMTGDVVIDWAIPSNGIPYEGISFTVGDTITFNWAGFHDAFFYPSKSCDDSTGAIEIGLATGASYTFQEADGSPEGTKHFIVCTVGSGSHCNLGQNIMVTVFSKSGEASGEMMDDTGMAPDSSSRALAMSMVVFPALLALFL